MPLLLGNPSSVLSVRTQRLLDDAASATSIWRTHQFLTSCLYLTLNNYFYFKGQILLQLKPPRVQRDQGLAIGQCGNLKETKKLQNSNTRGDSRGRQAGNRMVLLVLWFLHHFFLNLIN